MIQETFYIIRIEKVQIGMKEQQSFERIYDSEHPLMKSENPPDQYGYKSVIKGFTDRTTLLEQRTDAVDVERVLKAINKGL